MPIKALCELPEPISDDDIGAVLIAAIKGSGPMTEPQLQKVADWAREIRINAIILEGIIAGDILVAYSDTKEMIFMAAEGR